MTATADSNTLRHRRTTVDQHGNPFVGDRAAVEAYDTAIDRLLRFHPDVVEVAFRLAAEQPDVPMAQALVAYLHLTSTDAPDVGPARDAWRAMGHTAMGERESIHRSAIGAWLDGDWIGASAALDALLQRWPSDLLALQIGHQLDFFNGDAANLRDRPGRSLLGLDPDHPHTAFVRGMQAFGLEESGHYAAAEAGGLSAVEVNRDDVWAIHAVVHVYEMQGRVDEGIRFLVARQDDWGKGNLFTVHNWWHLALYLLEAGEPDRALAIYDAEVHNDSSDGVPLEMLDASALLWRLALDGSDTGDRFAVLADAWATRIESTSWYVFNDVHAVMALVGAGKIAEAEQHIAALERYVQQGGPGDNVSISAEIGVPSCRAIIAFGKQQYDAVIDELMPIRRVQHHFGGSHAQRDAMARTLLESALRSGQLDLARALVSERLSLRDTSVYGWTQQARLEEARGDTSAAAEAEDRAATIRDRFAAAAYSGR
jgi:tetratricopeptide (TPR) repeat protein